MKVLLVLTAIAFAGVLLLWLWFSIYPRRDAIRLRIRNAAIAWIVTWTAIILGRIAHLPAFWPEILAFFVGYSVYQSLPIRKRRISARDRRITIARFEAKTGEKFNPRKHEIDHIIPFSRGGNCTADNLKVITREENRKKGAKSVRRDMFRWIS